MRQDLVLDSIVCIGTAVRAQCRECGMRTQPCCVRVRVHVAESGRCRDLHSLDSLCAMSGVLRGNLRGHRCLGETCEMHASPRASEHKSRLPCAKGRLGIQQSSESRLSALRTRCICKHRSRENLCIRV